MFKKECDHSLKDRSAGQGLLGSFSQSFSQSFCLVASGTYQRSLVLKTKEGIMSCECPCVGRDVHKDN